MIINVEKLKQENKSYAEFEITVGTAEIDIKDAEVKIPVKINFSVKLIGENVVVEGDYTTILEYQCVRCLEKFEDKFEGKFETVFYTEDTKEDDEEIDFYDGEAGKEPLKDGKIDIIEFVRECMILEMEQYPICSKECKGVDKFEEYDNKGMDPRWQQLINIIKENK